MAERIEDAGAGESVRDKTIGGGWGDRRDVLVGIGAGLSAFGSGMIDMRQRAADERHRTQQLKIERFGMEIKKAAVDLEEAKLKESKAQNAWQRSRADKQDLDTAHFRRVDLAHRTLDRLSAEKRMYKGLDVQMRIAAQKSSDAKQARTLQKEYQAFIKLKMANDNARALWTSMVTAAQHYDKLTADSAAALTETLQGGILTPKQRERLMNEIAELTSSMMNKGQFTKFAETEARKLGLSTPPVTPGAEMPTSLQGTGQPSGELPSGGQSQSGTLSPMQPTFAGAETPNVRPSTAPPSTTGSQQSTTGSQQSMVPSATVEAEFQNEARKIDARLTDADRSDIEKGGAGGYLLDSGEEVIIEERVFHILFPKFSSKWDIGSYGTPDLHGVRSYADPLRRS